ASDLMLDADIPLLHIRRAQIRIGYAEGGLRVDPEIVLEGARDLEGGSGDGGRRRGPGGEAAAGHDLRQPGIVAHAAGRGRDILIVHEVDAVAGADGGFTIASRIPGQTDVGSEIVKVRAIK